MELSETYTQLLFYTFNHSIATTIPVRCGRWAVILIFHNSYTVPAGRYPH